MVFFQSDKSKSTNQMSQTQERYCRKKSESVAPEDVKDDLLAGDVGEDVLACGHVHYLWVHVIAQQGPA